MAGSMNPKACKYVKPCCREGHARLTLPYLSIEKIDEVAEATQEENVPLVTAHTMAVELAVHEKGLLLVEGQTLQLRVVEDFMAANRRVSMVYAYGCIFTVGHRLVHRKELIRSRGRVE